ncbi:MAG: nucleotidyl transferase AbiEii/AbiGii toxin family protein [Victivallales bacterium]
MTLFDKLVEEALRNRNNVAGVRAVVEKELLHHDILRVMSKAGLLRQMTFMGGTCLRACYGAQRLSEDLDFTGGGDFKREDLQDLAQTIIDRLREKYELDVSVSEPHRETGNTNTWKIKVVTQPERKNLPAQKINIDVCAIPSHQPRPMVLINHYGVDMGTGGLIIQCQTREEILLDKIFALALRLNRIKNRDLWDISWLKQQNIILPVLLSEDKVNDHGRTRKEVIDLLERRCRELEQDASLSASFHAEMIRFLPSDVADKTVVQPGFWEYIASQAIEESLKVIKHLKGQKPPSSSAFPMTDSKVNIH